jgi:hypothetical protein
MEGMNLKRINHAMEGINWDGINHAIKEIFHELEGITYAIKVLSSPFLCYW